MEANRMYMKSQFSVNAYKEGLLEGVVASREVTKISDWIKNPVSNAVVLRHDVDRHFANAVHLARAEAEFGVASVYYFRCNRMRFPEAEVEAVRDLGHEVGYHYEVLSKTNGNVSKGIELFATELEELRKLAPVETASMHGSPLSPYDNRLIWSDAIPSDFDLVGEAYISIDYSNVIYLTDTGRSWRDDSVNLRDKSLTESVERRVENLNEICQLFDEDDKTVIISSHPERWAYNKFTLARSYSEDLASNFIKSLIIKVRGRN